MDKDRFRRDLGNVHRGPMPKWHAALVIMREMDSANGAGVKPPGAGETV